MPLCCLKCGSIPGSAPTGRFTYNWYTHCLYRALKLIRAGCGTRSRDMRSLTFAACSNKTLFSIFYTTSPLAKSWIRACMTPWCRHIAVTVTQLKGKNTLAGQCVFSRETVYHAVIIIYNHISYQPVL